MLISFSIPEMRPAIEAGIRLRQGRRVTGRTKLQTIRPLKPGGRWWRLLQLPLDKVVGRTLDLWWKSRTPDRHKFGALPLRSLDMIIIGNADGVIRVSMGGRFLRPCEIRALSWADHFDHIDDFRRFFVPTPGDGFTGVLIKW